MPQPQLASLENLEGVKLRGSPAEVDFLLTALHNSLPAAIELLARAAIAKETPALANAAKASVLAVSALVTATAARCNLASPPEDIEVKVDTSGNMVYRCLHTPAHRWNLAGEKL